MKTRFEKRLIGCDQVAINQKLDLWQDATAQLNDLSRSWDEYFEEPFTPELITGALRTKPVEYFIQVHFIQNDPELAKLAEAQRVKMEKLIEITDFPDYEQLKNTIVAFKDWLVRKNFQNELENSIEKLYIDEKYVFPDAIKASIEDQHTYFTRDEYENAALELIENVCAAINAINDLGGNISGKDLPYILQSCITTGTGAKTFGELKSGASESRFFVPRLFPNWGMFQREDNALLLHVKTNLKFQ
ncbi:MAG TPA: hypothetical protein ENN90_15170 [Mariniphaga anaerophila]|mgnify:CR=1 FL=1|uniref:Uncharacterized protein n=1 Tax=Mariniphaga anaerophila TaxID=1484053 RepID=A0A831LU20_9BACT|nr:hypothetical protein [Mariniphaga anaerophila]